MKRFLGRHWETLTLLAVAVLCAISISALNRGTAPASQVSSRTIAGLTGPQVEKAAAAVHPGATSNVSMVSGRRSITYRMDGSNDLDASITVSSVVSGGAVTLVECEVDSTPARPLTVAGNAILKFCATLPGTGADTVAWADQQFAAASVGYANTLTHNGNQYRLAYSQYSNDRTHYEVTVLPPSRY